MNIWVEYWKKDNPPSLKTDAQMRENAKWVKPDEKDIRKRFCQDREQASNFAKSMQEQGYHVSIKTDGMGP